MKTTILTSLAWLSILTTSASAQVVLYNHTFDGVANDSTPAVQAFDNGASAVPAPDLAAGLLGPNLASAASGFNTASSIDLSAETSFTVEFVVENNSSEMVNGGFNGNFFGITSSATSNGTGGTALYNNAGSDTGPAIGLQVGLGRGTALVDHVLDNVAGNGVFTDIVNDFTDDATDGYSVFVTYTDVGDGTTDVKIATTGLLADIDATINEAIAFSAFSSAVTPNVSSQGGTLDLASVSITKPSSAIILGDCDFNGVVNFLDISPFISILSAGNFVGQADCNEDGAVSFLDISPFITILAGS